MSDDPAATDVVTPQDVADATGDAADDVTGDAVEPPTVYDETVERGEAAAASQASVEAARPRDPRPSTVVDPRRELIARINEVFDAAMTKRRQITPVILPSGDLADAAIELLSGMPPVPIYHSEDTPAERFYDRRGVDLDPDEVYIPVGVTAGGLPKSASVGIERIADGVAVPVRPEMSDDPIEIVELSLPRALAFALGVLGAVYAPEPEPPVDESP